MLALDDRRLLVLERGFAAGQDGGIHQTIQIFETTIDGDVLSPKRLVLDVQDVVRQFTKPFQQLDNFEGMCFGPPLEDGGRTVLLVSDDNYNERQRTSFFGVSIDGTLRNRRLSDCGENRSLTGRGSSGRCSGASEQAVFRTRRSCQNSRSNLPP